jgi:hypothetical protein
MSPLRQSRSARIPFRFRYYLGRLRFLIAGGEVPWWYHGQKYRGSPRRIDPRADYSESAPLSTQADVLLTGDSWRYPFDKYSIIADVNCDVFATPDRKDYFRILGNGYTLTPKYLTCWSETQKPRMWDSGLRPSCRMQTLRNMLKTTGPTCGAMAVLSSS